jgi:mono/diheme cytochrome c family protein
MFRLCALLVVVITASLLVACEAAAPGVSSGQAAASKPPASSAQPAQSAGPAAAQSEPKTVADVFPPGPGREQVMNNCASCHNVACSAIGQRSAERWDALRDGHKENVQGADLNAIFTYLKANFDDTKPAPNVPARFLEGGCTPF